MAPNRKSKSPNGEIPRPVTDAEVSGLSRDADFDPSAILEPIDQIFADQMGGDYEIYDALLQDSQVNACYQQRELAVTSKPWEVIPGGSESEPTTDLEREIADLVRAYQEGVGWDEVTTLMLRCRHYGFRIAELLWTVEDGQIALPKVLVRRNQRFRFGSDLMPRLVTEDNAEGEPLPEHNFWWITSGASHSDDPYGVGGSALYWLVKIKQQALKAWLNYLETLTIPTVVGSHSTSASQEERAALLEAAEAIADGAKAVRVSDDSVLKLLEATRSGTVDYPTLIGIMDAAISKVILSQTMTTDDGSSLSQSATHFKVREEIVEADAALIDDSFNRQVLAPWTFWNYGPDVRPPRVARNLQAAPDRKALAEVDEKLAGMGFLRTAESVKEAYGDGYVFVGNNAPVPENKESPTETPETANSPQNGGGNATFAEPSPEVLGVDLVKAQLSELAGPIILDWVRVVKGVLMEAKDLPRFSEGLYSLFPEMESEQFVELMHLAFAATRGGGAYDATLEAEE